MIKNYPGSKNANGAWQQIISQVPKVDLFIEAMAGSAIISHRLTGSVSSIVINDIDRSVIDRNTHAAAVLENLDYRSLIAKYDHDTRSKLFYFDPPYLMETRSYQGKLYRYEWNNNDHNEFLAMAITVKSNCMISHYPCELYDKELKEWRSITFQSMTRAGVRTEKLYMNYPVPALLADHKFVGENYTDRQRISRKVKRLIAKLNNEKDIERAAILSAIVRHYSGTIAPND